RGAIALDRGAEFRSVAVLLEPVFLFEAPPAELDAEAGTDIEPIVEGLIAVEARGVARGLILKIGPAAFGAGIPDRRSGRADQPLRLRLGHAQHCGERDAGTD